MNPLRTSELIEALRKRLGEDFVTVCPVNELVLNKNGIYVVNTDNRVGKHWVVIYVTTETVEFYDSFGRHPKFLQNGPMFMHTIHKTGKSLVVTSKAFQQHKSNVCGWYCLAYAFIRVKSNSVQKFYDMFSNDAKRNDQLIILLVKKLFLL